MAVLNTGKESITNKGLNQRGRLRIAILWASLADYTVSFFSELAKLNCEIALFHHQASYDAPYKAFNLEFCKDEVVVTNRSYESILNKLSEFSPQVILMASWNYPYYMRLARSLKKEGCYVVAAIDNQWYGSFKQHVGKLVAPILLKPAIDTFLVAGDRQASFVEKLGYENVLYGLYAASTDKFTVEKSIEKRPSNFLYVGRLVREKGIENLLEGYKIYRSQTTNPWGLKVIGKGPLAYLLNDQIGIEVLGFVQPEKLPLAYGSSKCFILPSLREHWGVVIHEAASSGLPIIATHACGAVTAYVRDGVNGFIIGNKPEDIASAMRKISNLTLTEIEEYSQISMGLARLWTPSKLATYFVKEMHYRTSY